MGTENLAIDRKRLSDVRERYGVKRLEAFGSLARGEAGAESDIDILVTLQAGQHLGLDFVALKNELRDLFGRPVDLLNPPLSGKLPQQVLQALRPPRNGTYSRPPVNALHFPRDSHSRPSSMSYSVVPAGYEPFWSGPGQKYRSKGKHIASAFGM